VRNESCKSTPEKLSDILLSVVNRQLVDHLDSGSAVSITEEDRLRTTQSKTDCKIRFPRTKSSMFCVDTLKTMVEHICLVEL
jgi:hypothetical protein